MIVTCDYDELSENNLLNQILKSTVFLLLRQKDVQEKYKAELKKKCFFLGSGPDRTTTYPLVGYSIPEE